MFILTAKSLYPSARALRDKIDSLCGERFRIRTEYPAVGNVAIRWGNSVAMTNAAKDGNLNSAFIVRLMANKKIFSVKYANDFWVPDFRQDTPRPEDFPVLIRTTMTGFGGVGIIPCANINEFQRHWEVGCYWTKYIDLATEFRVHVFDGEVLRIFKKVKDPYIAESKYNIRNSAKGWHFSPVENQDSLVRLRELANSFWNVTQNKFKVEHAFFALDVGWNRERKQYFILEGNTAPGIVNNPTTCERYAQKFIKILGL